MSTNRRRGSIAIIFCLLLPLAWPLSSPDKSKDAGKHYGLIFGTAWGPDDRPVYGAKIQIHPVGRKKPHWDLITNRRGEFTQPVPAGPGDYTVTGEVEVVPLVDGKPQKKAKLRGERTVHIEAEEREDIGLHLAAISSTESGKPQN